MHAKGLNERTVIAEIFAPLAADTPGAFNLEDDAARLSPPEGKDLVITTDVIVAGVHFIGNEPADTIAAKALRVNLSDLAAKGAEPLGYTLCLALDEECTLAWVRDFAAGLQRDQQAYGISLYGGDTVKTPGPLSISIMAFGTVEKGGMIQRSGAQVGDHLYVTGTIGDGVFGLGVARGQYGGLSDEHKEFLLQRYRCPQPRCALVPALVKLASAAMDVSDGLVGDIGALCAVSGVSVNIDIDDIPLSAAVEKLVTGDEKLLRQALTGGDDYEIICTVAPANADEFETLAKQCSVSLGRIGVIMEGVNHPQFFDSQKKQVVFAVERYEH
jgi:thiamine-monophosphate kinase